MRIQEGLPVPDLSQLGIVVHRLAPLANTVPAENSLEPAEELLLSGLQLLDFDRAYLVGDRQKSQIPLQVLNQSQLVQALQQVGQRLDLEHALTLHHCASQLIDSLRSTQPQTETPLLLRLEGAFGDIEIELARLQPDTLRAAFASGLAQTPDTLAASHQEWAGLIHRIRAGFGNEAASTQPLLQNWLAASTEEPFQLERFFQRALGFHPLNENASVRHLLAELEATETGTETRDTLENRLAERVEALLATANELEATLELAPRPDSPDVLSLLQSFLSILQQLQADQASLLRLGTAKNQLDRHVLAQFAERLHRQLRHHQDQLSALDQSGPSRLQLLIGQSLQQISARHWLGQNQQAGAVPAPAWQTLEQRPLF